MYLKIKLYTLIFFASRIISFSGSSSPIGSLKNVKLSIVSSFVLTEKRCHIIIIIVIIYYIN